MIVGGLDTTVFKPPADKRQVRREIGVPENSLILLTAANLVEKKGIDTVLRVVAELASRWSNLHYVIVGDGPYGAYLRELAVELGISDRIIFAGREEQTVLARYYQAANIYVQVSQNETMGRTYMEAGACGIPVVAANVEGVPSVVIPGVNGLLVDDPKNQDEVAAAVDRLLSDTGLRQRLGQTGLKIAREKFSWQRVAVAFEEVMVDAMDHDE